MSKTFRWDIHLQVKTIIGDKLLDELIERGSKDDAPEFLKQLYINSVKPEDGHIDRELFAKTAIKGILRGKIRGFTAHLIEHSGLSGTVAPLRITEVDLELSL